MIKSDQIIITEEILENAAYLAAKQLSHYGKERQYFIKTAMINSWHEQQTEFEHGELISQTLGWLRVDALILESLVLFRYYIERELDALIIQKENPSV